MSRSATFTPSSGLAAAIQLIEFGAPLEMLVVPSIGSFAISHGAARMFFVLCVDACVLGAEVFDGRFSSEAIAWSVLAKGIFCSVTLVTLSRILDGVIAMLGG